MSARACHSSGAPESSRLLWESYRRSFDSDPDPAGPAAGGPRYAGFWRRFAAFAVDWVVLSVLADIVRFSYTFGRDGEPEMISLDAAMVISGILILSYFSLLTAEGGQTLGKKVLGIRVVRLDGSSVSFLRSLLRVLAYGVSVFFGTFLGFLWTLWDRKKQGWHDKIAGTVVIKI